MCPVTTLPPWFGPTQADTRLAWQLPDLVAGGFMNRLVVALTAITVSVGTIDFAQTASAANVCENDVPLLMAASTKGDADAMVCIGIKYSNYGSQVPRDDVKATQWFIKAADAGQAMGMFMAGVALWSGRGIEKDMVEAHKWLDLSTRFSDRNQPAQTALDGLTRVLSPQQVAEAKKRVADWERNFAKRKES